MAGEKFVKKKPTENKFMQKGRILVSNQSNYNSAKVLKMLTIFSVSVTGSHLYEATVFVLSFILLSNLLSQLFTTSDIF